MNKNLMVSGLVLAAASPAVFPASAAFANVFASPEVMDVQAASENSPFGMFVSKPVEISLLGMHRQVVITIKLIRNGNHTEDASCKIKDYPHSLVIDIRDPETMKILQNDSRWALAKDGNGYSAFYSHTGFCDPADYHFELTDSGDMRLVFPKHPKRRLMVYMVGEVDIHSGDVFKRVE